MFYIKGEVRGEGSQCQFTALVLSGLICMSRLPDMGSGVKGSEFLVFWLGDMTTESSCMTSSGMFAFIVTCVELFDKGVKWPVPCWV